MTEGIENYEAVKRYVKKREEQGQVFHCGFCVNRGMSVLGAFSDRVTSARDGQVFGLVDIKTLASAKQNKFSLEEAIKAAAFMNDNEL
ncbi:hypothetical protein HPB47_004973, partial [Ixodes persulcatus]